jgi:uncharacterized ferritin-like protein (DUF455 family)
MPKKAKRAKRKAVLTCYTIELRTTFKPASRPLMRSVMRHAAKHIYLNAVMLAADARPEIALFSDDFYEGRKEIE